MTRAPDVVFRARSSARRLRADGTFCLFLGLPSRESNGYCWSMLKRVEILVDDGLLQEVIRRHHLADAREAVHMALKALLDGDGAEHQPEDDEYDEFSDPSAWLPRRSSGPG